MNTDIVRQSAMTLQFWQKDAIDILITVNTKINFPTV